MRQKWAAVQPFTPLRSGMLQRMCDCGRHTIAGGACDGCSKKRLQRRAANQSVSAEVPSVVHEVLRSSGQPLDIGTRNFMETGFGHDFSQVRVHTDAKAAESAHSVNALAYTVGRNIVFAQEQYQPATPSGRHLLAHELTHIVQQRGVRSLPSADRLTLDSTDSPLETEARRIGTNVLAGRSVAAGGSSPKAHLGASAHIVSRADPGAVTVVMNLGRTPRTGLQFWPTNVLDTRVGPVSVQGGLMGGQASQLNVIIGANLTPRTLARLLLPLWITATPFTPPGAAAPLPLDIITEEELAQGLLVYNRYYLPVPAMTNWRAGLRFPLPVEIDEVTGMATLNPSIVKSMAGEFDPAWTPLLDQRAGATAQPNAATLQADVAAFLAQETTALARGIHLGARALTNAVAALPFISETFNQLGAGGFEVALAFMDNMVNREVALLAAQLDGAAILIEINFALLMAPAVLTATQQASLDRARLMLGQVARAATAPTPAATRTRADKSLTIDTVKLDGSSHNPASDVAVASAIFSQCNVRLAHGINATASPVETTTWLGGNTDLRTGADCAHPTAEQSGLFRHATTRFGLRASLRAFFPATLRGTGAAGYSVPPFCAIGGGSALRGMAVISNIADTGDFAHEVGHILLNSGAHPAANLMNPYGPPQGERLTNNQCNTINNNV